MDDLLYVIPAKTPKNKIASMLKSHPEIKFVSLVGIDLAGNDTDEKIPMRIFLKDMDEFYAGTAVQTDGSSVVLPGIATLNNAKVDMPIDPSVNWFVDYNYEHYDEETERPVGTLRIPAFLIHEGRRVDSRAVLADTLSFVKKELLALFKKHPKMSGLEHVNGAEVADIFGDGTGILGKDAAGGSGHRGNERVAGHAGAVLAEDARRGALGAGAGRPARR